MRLSWWKKRRLLKAYRAFYDRIMKQEGEGLTEQQRKAIGQKVLDDILEASFRKLNIPKNQQMEFRQEFEKLIRKKFPDLLLHTPIEFNGKSYVHKR